MIPVVKYDESIPELALSPFRGDVKITEGWVTINGHHILIGDDKERMAGGASEDKEFAGKLTPEQEAVANKIQTSFSDSWQPSDVTHLPEAANKAARALAAAGFNPKILEENPLATIKVDDKAAKREDSSAYYAPYDKSMTLAEGVKDPIFIHEFGHHLDFTWMGSNGGDFARAMGVSQLDVAHAAKATVNEAADTREKIFNILRTDPRSEHLPSGGFKPSPELNTQILNMAPSKYAVTGDDVHEWIAEGVRQYVASPRSRNALHKNFPKTYDYVHGLVTGEFPKGNL